MRPRASPVSEVTTADALAVLTPIWHDKPEIARRVRQRIGAGVRVPGPDGGVVRPRRTHEGEAGSPRPALGAGARDPARRTETSDGTGLVFRSLRGKPLSTVTLSELIKELSIAAVLHWFRSSFRDWAAERTNTPREVVEAALAHTVHNPTEAAYARSDLFERRRHLMDEWRPISVGHTARRSTVMSGQGRLQDTIST